MVHRKPRIWRPRKDIATNGKKTRPVRSSTVTQNFTPIGRTVAEISVSGQKKQLGYSKQDISNTLV